MAGKAQKKPKSLIFIVVPRVILDKSKKLKKKKKKKSLFCKNYLFKNIIFLSFLILLSSISLHCV